MNWLFLALEFVIVSAALIGAYSLRSRVGLGPVIAVVASIQFIQALLAAGVYWSFGPELLLTPGSCVLFAANLAILIFAFARDGVLPARAILYGIVIANVVNTVVNVVVAAHIRAVEPVWLMDIPPEIFDLGLVGSLVGTALLYVDQVLAILAFAWLQRRLPWLPNWAAMALVLTAVLAFDTVGYLVPLFWRSPELGSMLASGLVSKSAGGLAFGVVWGLILTRQEARPDNDLSEILSILLFREGLVTLRQAAITDDMTGLYNRRSYRLMVERLVDKSRSTGEGFSLVLIDADHFKGVNDLLGHSTGDEVLTAIASTLRTATRGDDLCFRLGGDEFALALPNCDLDGAREVAGRVGAFRFAHEALPKAVTLTLGLAHFPTDAADADALFEVADKRLYEGKRRGRARVVGGDEG